MKELIKMKNRLPTLFLINFLLSSILCEESSNFLALVPSLETSEALKLASNAPFEYEETRKENDIKNDDNWLSVSEILDVFNVRHLASKWEEGKYGIDKNCEKDISRYIEGLKKHEFWALKMDDASGRFTNGFFWGNTYFVGSATECEYIGNSEARALISAESSEPKKQLIHGGLSGKSLPVYSGLNDAPPYPLGFFMMRIYINETLSPVSRLIHLGACLPFSCKAADVAVIAKLAASDIAAKHSVVEKVRDQHNSYQIFDDPLFWALFGISSVVLFLLICGSTYDLYLMRKMKKAQMLSYNLEKHVKLEQITNGKPKSMTETQGKVYIPVPVAEPVVTVTVSPPVNNNNDHEGSLHSSTSDLLKLNVWEELLLSFSIPANLKVICDGEVGRDTISTIHGLRAISMAWVILGHTCIVVFKYSDNMEYRKIVEKRFLYQTLQNGAFSVDTFFFMGGLLVSFLYFRTNAKGDLNRLTQGTRGFVAGLLKFLGFLAYRFCRLTTPYMFVLGVVVVTMKWFNQNSVFETPAADHVNCPNYWWRNLLYINTLYPVEQMCMLWSWYVADDTQFYVVGAIILIIATNHFKVAAFTLVTLMISSWVTTGYIALVNNHMPNKDDPLALFDKIYDKPWTRLGPYLIGMTVGYILFKTDCRIKMSKVTAFIGWFSATACILSLLFGLYETDLSPAVAAAYSSLSHSAWALSLAWVVVACSTGYGGYINDVLSAPILYPFSRVTYCAYLVHPLVIRLTIVCFMDSPLHLSKDSMLITFLGQVVASYILSFIVSLSFEAPAVSMLKILSPKKRKRI